MYSRRMFGLQLFLSFFVGGFFVAFQTLLAERAGHRWRGVVLSIPSTLALGLFFIGLIKTPQSVKEAVSIVPIAEAGVFFFVTAFVLLVRFGLLVSMTAAVFLWALTASIVLHFPPADFIHSVFYGLIAILLAYFLLYTVPTKGKLQAFPINTHNVLIRALVGGTVIFTTVLLSKILGPIWGGLFSVFPAVFASTFVIYYHAHGKESIPLVGKGLFFPGSIGFMVYAAVAGWAFPEFGIWVGTLLAYMAVVLFLALWKLGFYVNSSKRGCYQHE